MQSTVYKTPEAKSVCLAVYDATLARWPVPYDEIEMPTRFGRTHLIASGATNAPALVLLVSILSIRSRIPFRPAFGDEEFRTLKMPVLLLIGDGEAMYEPNVAIERARQLIPQIEAELVPHAGHVLTVNQPMIVTARIRQFLRQHQISSESRNATGR